LIEEKRGEMNVMFPTLYLNLFSSQNEREIERMRSGEDEPNG
jgi:hypothetical protein